MIKRLAGDEFVSFNNSVWVERNLHNARGSWPIHRLYQLFSQSVNQSVIQSIGQLVGQSINQSIIQSINRSVNYSINQLVNYSINQSITLFFVSQSIIQSINQPVNQSISLFFDTSQIKIPKTEWGTVLRAIIMMHTFKTTGLSLPLYLQQRNTRFQRCVIACVL